MRLLAAAAIGTSAAVLAGLVAGVLPGPPRTRRVRPARVRAWLRQAGVAITPAQFVATSIGLGVGALAILTALTGSVAVAFVPAIALALLPRVWLARRRTERLRAIQAAWPDAIRDVVASVASGRSLGQAVGELGISGPEALRPAFARYRGLERMLGTAAALELVREQLADPTSDRVLEVLVLAQEQGGAVVVRILEDLVDATTRDLRLLEELASEGLEMQLNARVVVALPWAVLVLLTATDGPFRDFYRSPAGLAVLLVGAVMAGAGLVVVSRLGRDPREPRVLVATRSGGRGG